MSVVRLHASHGYDVAALREQFPILAQQVNGRPLAYLDNGALPNRVHGNRSDKQCDPVPQPNPTAAAAKALASTGSGSVKATLRNAVPAVR